MILAPLTSVYSSAEITGLAAMGGSALRDAGSQADIARPLVAHGRRIGILVLANSTPLPIGHAVAESLEVLSTLAGASLEIASNLIELRARANQDALTGLGNHAWFHEELRTRDLAVMSIALFDVDRFEWVNDSLGNLAGDRVLKDTALALKSAAVDGSLLFRIGGDEFAALLPTANARLRRHARPRARPHARRASLRLRHPRLHCAGRPSPFRSTASATSRQRVVTPRR